LERQRTIQKKIEFSGKGVHTGGECRVKLLPAEVDTGILFVKKPENVKIEAHYSRVLSTTRGTTLGYREVKIHTGAISFLYVSGVILNVAYCDEITG